MIGLRDLHSDYLRVLEIVRCGDVVAPRDEQTFEILNASLQLPPDVVTMPVGMNRKVNLAIGAVEALQLIGGVSRPDVMVKISKTFERFLENDGTQAGPYGPPVGDQLPVVIHRLQEDPSTRRATLTIWNPNTHGFYDSLRDYPCTITMQFMVRRLDKSHDALNLHVWMRSNDVWWGLAYDVFQFTQLQASVARCLGLPVGWYFHNAASLHMYHRDLEAAANVHEPRDSPAFWPSGVGRDGDPLPVIQSRARTLLDGHLPDGPTPSEEWYHRVLSNYI